MGHGKGVGTYFKSSTFSPEVDMKKEKVQITKISASEVDVFNIYRSQEGDKNECAIDLRNMIDQSKTSIICGDLNLCFVNQRNNEVTRMLEDNGFVQLVNEATHLMGGHIDHVYSNHDPNKYTVDVMMYSPFYTCKDHDALCITIKHRQKKSMRE